MSDVKNFFSGTGDKKAYYVDVVYNYKDLDRGFQSQMNMTGLLETVTSIDIKRMDKAYAQELAGGIVNDFEMVEGKPDDKTTSPTVQTLRLRGSPLKKDSNWSDPKTDVVTINMTTRRDDAGMSSKLYNSLVTKLQDPSVNTNAKRKLEELPKSHRSAQEFMTDVTMSFSLVRFVELVEGLATEARGTKFDNFPDLKSSLNRINELSATKRDEIVNSLHAVASISVASMVQRKKPSVYLLDGYAPGVGDGTAFEQNTFKNLLRDNIYDKLIIRGMDASDDQLAYMRRVLSELYVIAFYPYIHFLYITELMKYFMKIGDFVNMRVTALSKVMFTANLMIGFYENTQSQPTFAAGQEGKKATDNVLTYWVGALKNYFVNLSAVDFNSNMSLTDIVADVHELSARVTDQSYTVDQLKSIIKKTQLDIRSILSRYKQIQGQQQSAKVKYGLLLALLFIIIFAGGAMIVMNMYKDYLLYGLVGVSFLVTMVSFIMLIKRKVSGN